MAIAEEVKLRMVVWDGNDGLPVLRAEVKEFEKAHPGVSVTLEGVEYNSYFQKLLGQVAADVAPDVAMLAAANIQTFAKRGALLPLGPLMKETPECRVSDYYETAIRADTYQGQLYILPRDVAPIGLVFYNKDAFREAGIPFPDGTWTWDFEERPELREKDFTWVMHKLTKFDSSGKATRWGFTMAWPNLFADTLAYSTGARYVDRDDDPSRVTFDDPRVIRSYQLAADLALKRHYIPTQNQINSELQSNAAQLFVSGRVAMFQGGVWETQGIRDRNKLGSKDFFDWDVTLMPAYKDGTRAAPGGGSGYAVMAQTKHPKEAWLLTQWMAGPHGMRAMAKAGFAQPAIKSLAQEWPWLPRAGDVPEKFYPANKRVMHEAVQYAVDGCLADYWVQITDITNPRNDSIWNGSESAATQLKLATKLANDELAKIHRKRNIPPFNWPLAATGAALIVAGIAAWVYGPEFRRKLSPKDRIENRAGYWFILPGLLGLVGFTLGPMLLSLMMSLANWDIITPAGWRGLDNYREAFAEDPRFWKALATSAIYTAVTVPLGVTASLFLALLLNTKTKAMPLFRTVFYLPALASAVASSLIWQKVFQQDGGLLNTLIFGANGKGNLLGLGTLFNHITGKPGPVDWLGNERLALPSICLMSLWGVGGGMIILLAGLQGVPTYYYEAARLDGANAWHQFRRVTLPMLAPSLFFVTVTSVIGSFQVFTQAFVVTKGGPNDSTRFYMLHLYEEAFRNLHMGYASALAWILFVIILTVTAVQFGVNKLIYYEAELK